MQQGLDPRNTEEGSIRLKQLYTFYLNQNLLNLKLGLHYWRGGNQAVLAVNSRFLIYLCVGISKPEAKASTPPLK